MRCPISVSIVGWFLVGLGVIFSLVALLGGPLPPEVAAAAASGPRYGWPVDVLWRASSLGHVVAGGLVLRGARQGRTLFLACGALTCVVTGLPRGAQVQPLMAVVACILAAGFAMAAWLLFRAPARWWLGLAPTLRQHAVWSVRGVLSGTALVVGGALLAGCLFGSLFAAADWFASGAVPAPGRLGLIGALSALLAALGLALGPRRSAGRRLSVLVLCAALVTLIADLWVGVTVLTPAMASALPPDFSADKFGYALPATCPVLLVPLALCVLRLRREPAGSAGPG